MIHIDFIEPEAVVVKEEPFNLEEYDSIHGHTFIKNEAWVQSDISAFIKQKDFAIKVEEIESAEDGLLKTKLKTEVANDLLNT